MSAHHAHSSFRKVGDKEPTCEVPSKVGEHLRDLRFEHGVVARLVFQQHVDILVLALRPLRARKDA
jgi:putative component of toxin-antitoxin plasmid stabilization module